MALECGYSESYQDLRQDATLLMEGSKGAIGKVILVKLDPIWDSGEVENGFVEVWGYSPGSGSAKRRGGRFVRLSLTAPIATDICQEDLPAASVSPNPSDPIHRRRNPAGEVRR